MAVSHSGFSLQLRENLFEKPSAYALLALSKSGEPIGFALYYFNFSTWTGKPGIYVNVLSVNAETGPV